MPQSNINTEQPKEIEQEAVTAEVYGLLACLLREPPSTEVLQWLRELEVEPCEQHAMTNAWFRLKEAALMTSPEQVADEYQDLFIGIGCGEVVPFSSWHIAGTLMEKPLVAIRQDLKRFGFERQDDIREPEDSISALLEVMSMLQSEAFDAQQQFLMPIFARGSSHFVMKLRRLSQRNFICQFREYYGILG